MPTSLRIAAALVVTTALVQSAQAQKQSPASEVPTATIVGRYEYRDQELVGVVSTEQGSVRDLALLTDNGANGELNMLTSGKWTVPLTQAWDTDEGNKGTPTKLPTNWEIVRTSDDRSLLKMTLVAGGANRFMFNYTPSLIEPFYLAVGLVDDKPGTIKVEFGSTSITMQRATPK